MKNRGNQLDTRGSIDRIIGGISNELRRKKAPSIVFYASSSPAAFGLPSWNFRLFFWTGKIVVGRDR